MGISDEYLLLALWYVSVDGSDFFSFLSSHCPHLSSDVAKDFSSGSSLPLSTLRSSSALVSGPPASIPVALPSSSLFSFAVSSSGGVSSGLPWGSVAATVSSAGFLSSFPSSSASLSGPPPFLFLLSLSLRRLFSFLRCPLLVVLWVWLQLRILFLQRLLRMLRLGLLPCFVLLMPLLLARLVSYLLLFLFMARLRCLAPLLLLVSILLLLLFFYGCSWPFFCSFPSCCSF